jgi:hypothetical protein
MFRKFVLAGLIGSGLLLVAARAAAKGTGKPL